MTPGSVVSPTVSDIKIQQDFPVFVGSQSMATQPGSLTQAVLQSARLVKLWEIPPNP